MQVIGGRYGDEGSEIAVLMDEPVCPHNGKSKSGCSVCKLVLPPGLCLRWGSDHPCCSSPMWPYGGGGPIGCAGSPGTPGTHSPAPNRFVWGFTTDLSEQDVIHGARRAAPVSRHQSAGGEHQPAAVCVTTPARPAKGTISRPSPSGGRAGRRPRDPHRCRRFYGSKNLGNRIAGDLMVEKVVGREPAPWPTDAHFRAEQGLNGADWRVQHCRG